MENAVKVRWVSDAKTKFVIKPAMIRIRRSDDNSELVEYYPTNEKPLPVDVFQMIEYRVANDWLPLREELVSTSMDDIETRLRLSREAEDVLADIAAEAGAMLSVPVFDEYREQRGYKPGWTFYKIKESLGYDIATRVCGREGQ